MAFLSTKWQCWMKEEATKKSNLVNKILRGQEGHSTVLKLLIRVCIEA
jgi:hypothetical protein